MSIFSSYKKIFLLGFILVILIAIPFTVYIAQKRQQIVSTATKSTTLSFEPSSPTVKVNDILSLDIILDPGTGSTANQVSFVKLTIIFDPLKFTTESLKPNTDSPNTLTSVLEDTALTSGKATISLSIGADPTKVVTTKTKIATLKLKALSTTSTPSKIEFASSPNTQVSSIAASDPTSENVLSIAIPAFASINLQSTTPTPTTTPINPTSAPTPLPRTGSFPTSSPISTNFSTGSAVITPTFIAETLPTQVILPPTGPEDSVFGLGILGGLLILIGGALFIFL